MSPSPRFYYLHASANALGGILETPHKRVIPSQASSSLPEVGGHATNRTEAFNFEEILSCKTAYTRLTSSRVEEDGSYATLVTSVVEGLNILDVVKADRIVAQISVEHPGGITPPVFSFAGSHFDGLKLGGCSVNPDFNERLFGVETGDGVGWSIFQDVGHQQAVKMVQKAKTAKNTEWVQDRFGWMTPRPKGDGCVLCSLVDGINQPAPGRAIGHVLQIPHFGKIVLGEMLVFPTTVQLSMIRAELGCANSGSVTAAMSRGGGGHYPP
jgi:hypothetical protein